MVTLCLISHNLIKFCSTATLDDQLVIATERPPAIQCVLWQDPAKQSYTELLAKLDWIKDKGPVTHMVFDKPTSLFAWVTKDGKVYAVRKPGVSLLCWSFQLMQFSQMTSKRDTNHGKGGCFMIILKTT